MGRPCRTATRRGDLRGTLRWRAPVDRRDRIRRGRMKIWIDCSNTPHPLLFAPVARRLERDGHAVMVTARDHAQTVELVLERWPAAEVIGTESPRGRFSKVATL